MTPNPNTSARHATWDQIGDLLEVGAPAIEPIPGSPSCAIHILPDREGIALRVEMSTKTKPDPLPQSELLLRELRNGSKWYLELTTQGTHDLADFYTFICLVSDRIQIDGAKPLTAIHDTLSAWSNLLQERNRLSHKEEQGLIGELWFLSHLARGIGWKSAIEQWRGPEAEEHDFGLPRIDIEVKTTVRERRHHMIGSLTQMIPSPNRPLFVVSIQLTAASKSETGAMWLPSMIDTARANARAAGPETASCLDSLLEDLNWRDEGRDLFSKRFRLRSEPTLIPVDATFPALVPDLLSILGDLGNRILDVHYRIDVDGLGNELRTETGTALLEIQ